MCAGLHSDNPSRTPKGTGGALLDRLAFLLSGACAVHCLLTPLLVVLLPLTVAGWLTHPDFHFWMLALVVPSTGLAMVLGYRRHRDRITVMGSLGGVGLLALALFIGHGVAAFGMEAEIHRVDHHATGCCSLEPGTPALAGLSLEAMVTTLGGLVLVACHWRNLNLSRSGRSRGNRKTCGSPT